MTACPPRPKTVPPIGYPGLVDSERARVEALIGEERALTLRYFREYDAAREGGARSGAITIGAYRYALLRRDGDQYPHLARALKGRRWNTVLDLNALLWDGLPRELGVLRITPDHTGAAFTMRAPPDTQWKLYVHAFGSGKPRHLTAGDVHDAAWSRDGAGMLILRGENLEPVELAWIGAGDGDSPRRVLRAAPGAHLRFSASRDGRSALITEVGSGGRRWYRAPLIYGAAAVELIGLPSEASLCEADGKLILLHGAGPRAGAVSMFDDGSAVNGREILPPDPGVVRTGIECFARYFVLSQRRGAESSLLISSYSGKHTYEVTAPDPASSIRLGANPDFDPRTLSVTVASPIRPDRRFELDARSGDLQERPAAAGSSLTEQEQWAANFEVKASDGASIPLTVALPAKGEQPPPIVLYAYGAYGENAEQSWSPSRHLLLNSGIGIAIAQIRGGGELGPSWHAAGAGERKWRAIQDYLECAQALVRLGYAPVNGIIAEGRSAGAVIAARAAQLHPELFSAVILDAPLLDLWSAAHRSDQPFAGRENFEWGDPRTPDGRESLQRLDPLGNLNPHSFPPALLLANLHDEVIPWDDTRRWIERHRASARPGTLLVYIDERSGHAAASDSAAERERAALKHVFIERIRAGRPLPE